MTIREPDKPEAELKLNSGAKMLMNRVKALAKEFPKGINPSDYFTVAEISFIMGFNAVQDAMLAAHTPAE